jgi:hypothetical protein
VANRPGVALPARVGCRAACIVVRGTFGRRGSPGWLLDGSPRPLRSVSSADAQRSKQSSHQSRSRRWWAQGLVMALPSDASRLPSAACSSGTAALHVFVAGDRAQKNPARSSCLLSQQRTTPSLRWPFAGIHRPEQTVTLLLSAARRADSVPVRLIAEGSGGRSRRSSPS